MLAAPQPASAAGVYLPCRDTRAEHALDCCQPLGPWTSQPGLRCPSYIPCEQAIVVSTTVCACGDLAALCSHLVNQWRGLLLGRSIDNLDVEALIQLRDQYDGGVTNEQRRPYVAYLWADVPLCVWPIDAIQRCPRPVPERGRCRDRGRPHKMAQFNKYLKTTCTSLSRARELWAGANRRSCGAPKSVTERLYMPNRANTARVV